MDLTHVAREIPKDINDVHAGLEHEQPRHRPEIWLSIEVGVRAPAVTHPRAARQGVQIADGLQIEQPPELPMPGLKPEVVVHHQPDAGAFRIVDEGRGFGERRSERLLAEHVDPALSGETADPGMGSGRRNDVDEVRPNGIQHRRHIGIHAGDPEPARGRLRAVARRVAQRLERRTGHAIPRVVVELAEVSCPDRNTSEGCHVNAWSNLCISARICGT
jgi:hypothetical protein